MKLFIIVSFTPITSLLCCLVNVASSTLSGCLVFGVNGHPLAQTPYQLNTYNQQLQVLQQLHQQYYRVDVYLNPDRSGRIRDTDPTLFNFSSILDTLNRNGLIMLPVVFPTVVNSNNYTIAQLYQLSYEEGVRWTELYGSLFSVIELDNEQDNVCIKPGVDGINLDDYNRSCIDRVVAKMSGFAAGLKDTLSSLRIIIDFCWLHWGYMDYLTAASTRYDIVGYHWYSDMGDIRRSHGNISDVLQHVIDTYKKPIWVTETNTKNGDMNVPSYNQTSYINNTLNTILTYYPAVQSYVIYELFDEYQFNNSSGEAHYGLTKLEAGNILYKPVATAYRMWVDQYHQNICQQCRWAAQDSSQLVCAESKEQTEEEQQQQLTELGIVDKSNRDRPQSKVHVS
jgi:hypothetical protein